MFAIDPSDPVVIECPAPLVAGTYGAPQARQIEPGAYIVICDGAVVIRPGERTQLRISGVNKIELPFVPGVISPPILLGQSVVVASKAAAAVCWLVPCASLDGAVRAGKAKAGAKKCG